MDTNRYNLDNYLEPFTAEIADLVENIRYSQHILSDIKHFIGWINQKSHRNREKDISVKDFPKLYTAYLILSQTPVKTINRRLSSIRKFISFVSQKEDVSIAVPRNLSNAQEAGIGLKEALLVITEYDHELAVEVRSFLERPNEEVKHPYLVNTILQQLAFIDDSYRKRLMSTKSEENQGSASTTVKRIFHTKNLKKPLLSSISIPTLIQRYAVLIIIVLLLGLIGTSVASQFFKKTKLAQAFPTALTKGTRALSFQGRLTDSLGNPITTATNVVFKLYDAASSGSQLYTSGTCSITPDQDGIFNTLIGEDCGSEITSSVFTENAEVWLATTVGADSEMTPRQQIANVGYALNAETLQGFPPGTAVSNIPYINSDGNVLMGASTPGIRNTYASATFVMSSANAITLQSAGSGDITLTATESGTIKFLTAGTQAGVITNAQLWGIGTAGPDAKIDSLYTGGEQLRLTYTDGSVYTGFTTSSGGDLTIDPSGDDLTIGGDAILSDTFTVQAGGKTATAYNAFANSSDGPEDGSISSDNDVYIGGDLEVDGSIIGDFTATALPWSGLTAPTADLTVSMAAFNSTFTWDPGADTTETAFTMNFDGEDSAGDEDQVLLALNQSSNGTNVTEAADALLTFANSDANDPVENAIRFEVGAAGTDFTYGINFDAASIGTAELVLQNGETIANTVDGTIALTGDTSISGSTGLTFTSTGGVNLAGGTLVDSTDGVDVADNLEVSGDTTLTGDLAVNGDDITSDGTLTIDAATDIILDADGADVFLKDNATTFATLTNSSTDLTIDAAGGQVYLANADTFNVGGVTGLAYNAFSDSGTTSHSLASDNDVYIEGDAEVDGTLYVDGTLSAGTLACTDCLDFTSFEDTLDLDATTDINLGANNLTVDLDSTGIFDIRDGSTTFVSFDDDSTIDITFPAAGTLGIDATTTANTTTGGVIDLNVNAGDVASVGLNVDYLQANGATAGRDAIAQAINLTANDADGDVFGSVITANATTNAAAGSYEALLKLTNAENTVGAVTDGILISSTSGTDTDITDAIDVSNSNIVNAINVGANTVLGTTSNIDLTNFDIVGSSGDITTAGDIAVNGDDVTSDGDLTLNAAGYVRIGDTATPDSATGDDDFFVESDFEVDGGLFADGTIVQDGGDGSSFAGAITFNDDVDLTLAGTENLAIASDLAGSVNVVNILGTPSASAGTAYGLYVDQANSANSNGYDASIVIDNSDTNLAIADGLLFVDAGGTFTDFIDTPSSVFKVDGSGNITGVGETLTGDIAVNGGDITATGDLTINPGGGDVNLGSGDNLNLTASSNLTFAGTTTLAETTAANDSGAYFVGAFDEFDNSNSTTVQGVLNDLDAGLTTALANTSPWTDSGTTSYLTNTTDEVVIGGSSPLSSSKLSIDGDADQIQFTVQAHSTQTSNLAVFEDSTGTDLLTIGGTGIVSVPYLIDISNAAYGIDPAGTGNFGGYSLKVTGGALLGYDSGNVGIGPGAQIADELLHVGKATDGDTIALLLENSQAAGAASTNETSQLRFGFGGNNDTARIVAGKVNDYTSGANEDSFLSFYTDVNGTATEQLKIDEAGLATFTGDIAVNGDDITSDGTLTLDAVTDIVLDADGADIFLKDAGVTFATFTNSSTDLTLDVAGSQLVLADGDVFNIGAVTGLAYNAISDSGTTGHSLGSDDDLYVEGDFEVDGTLWADGAITSAGTITGNDIACTDCLDFTEFEDTLDLDAALTLNQSTNTWTQNFTGTTTDGLTYTANSMTTGNAVVISSTATSFSSGTLLSLDWSPGSLNTNTDDLFKINTTNNGNMSGYYINLLKNSATVLNIDQSGNIQTTGDVAVNGDDLTSDSNLTIAATGYVRVGDSGTPGSASGDDDLYVQDDLEIDGRVFVDGGLTIGDSAGDAVTVNSKDWTFANDTAIVLSGGVDGLNFDTNTLSIDATNNRIGIGTAAPDAQLHVTGAQTGKALVIFDETGDQNIFVASDSGSTVFSIGQKGDISQVSNNISGVNGLPGTDSLAPNGGFEVYNSGLTFPDGWVKASGTVTRDGSTFRQGDYSVALSTSSSLYSSCFPITEGNTYQAAAWALCSGVTCTNAMTISIRQYTSRSNCEGDSSGTTVASLTTVTNAWTNYGPTAITASLSGARWGRGAIVNQSGSTTLTVDSFKVVPSSEARGLDLAEIYPAAISDSIQMGEIVSMGTHEKQGVADINNVERSSKAYDDLAFGVIATNPGLVLDDGKDYEKVKVALKGRVPVLVNGENGPIAIGDSITASSTPGVGMKATKKGRIIGRAMTAYNPEHPSDIDQITVFVETGIYDPEVDQVEATGSASIEQNANLDQSIFSGILQQASPSAQIDQLLQSFNLRVGDQIINTSRSFGQVLSASIRTGIIAAKNAVVEGTLVAQSIVTNSLTATSAQIAQLTSASIQTDTIHSASIEATNIDTGTLNAGSVSTATLSAETIASKSITADVVQAKNIDALQDRLLSVAGQQLEQETNQQGIATSVGEITSTINQLQTKLASLQNTPLPDPTYYQPASQFSSVTISDDANIYNLYVSGAATIDDIHIDGSSIMALGNTLHLTALQSIDLLDGAMVISRDGTITTNSELIAQGGIKTNSLKPIDDKGDIQVHLQTNQGDPSLQAGSLSIQNEQGNQVASIDANGQAQFNKIKFDTANGVGPIIAASQNQSDIGILAPGIQTNASSAGSGILPANTTDVILFNTSLSEKSLVYLTPTSYTYNKSLFVASKNICPPGSAPTCKEYMKISIDQPIAQDVSFNWWIIE